VLHPNQTAYLPGKQIQDNLRLINIISKHAIDPVIVALDAKKAFDSVNHGYIRECLTAYGLDEFIPIFNLLYNEQSVDIAINGDTVKGYTIRNGVKQGDSLSCILFILCMDPLIRNIEQNNNIQRLEIDNFNPPKVLAYADDVTCLTDSKRSIRNIFREYERLSKASGLVLNADKTEILDRNSAVYTFKYMGDTYRVQGLEEAKINGVIFHRDEHTMIGRNYDMLLQKINKSLVAWKARRLSLLGKILIYKTFGLSQIIYVLTVIDLTEKQYQNIERLFFSFFWARDMGTENKYNRISKQKLCTPIALGGFGMINYRDIIEGIRCRQFGKLFNDDYKHPLKLALTEQNKSFTSVRCLKNIADSVAKKAKASIQNTISKKLKSMTSEQIVADTILLQQLGETETAFMVKESKRDSRDMMTLVHRYNCDNLKMTVATCRQHQNVVAICKRILSAKYCRILKAILQNNGNIPAEKPDKIKLAGGNYKYLYTVSSKEFRLLLKDKEMTTESRLGENLDVHAKLEYFSQIKRLKNMRHKNTLLRVWNGDCLSNSRLFHYGLVEDRNCPNCGEYDSPTHMLYECRNSKRIWEMLMCKIPKPQHRTIAHYVIGINDTKSVLMIKAELLKYVMHYRNLEPEVIMRKAIAYLKAVNPQNPIVTNL
jgi:hypothetical protein